MTPRAAIFAAVWLAMLWVGAACREQGSFSVTMTWAEGETVEPPVYVFARIEERRADPRVPENRVLGTAGPTLLAPGVDLLFDHIPNGERRVLVAEVRRYPEPEAPVIAVGLSEWFDLAPRRHVEVPVFLHLTSTPRWAERDSLIIETPGGRGWVRDTEVGVTLVADHRARAVRLSPDPAFDGSATVILPLEVEAEGVTPPPGFRAWRLPWDLEHGRADRCEVGHICPRDVFARAVDELRYESVTLGARVILDLEPPRLGPETVLSPTAAGPSTSVQLTLVASEELARAPVIRAPDAPSLAFRRILPVGEAPSATFTYLLEPFGAERPPDGVYRLVTDLEDLAGNVSAEVAVGELTLDVAEPLISQLEVSPSRVGIRGEVEIRFLLEEPQENVELRVTVAGLPVEECRPERDASPTLVHCRYVVSGLEAPGQQRVLAVLVTAVDRALNRRVLEHPLTVDLRPPDLVSLVLAPRDVREGGRAAVRLLADEILGRAPQLDFEPRDPGFVREGSSGSGLEALWLFAVGPSTAEGEFRLTRVRLEDEVGNVRVLTATVVPELLPAVLRVDRQAPRLSGISVSPSRVRRDPGTTVVVEVTVEELHPAGPPEVVLDGRFPLTCRQTGGTPAASTHRCEHVVRGDEVLGEGQLPLAITAMDAAGNETRDVRLLTFDFVPPAVHSVDLIPSPARSGDVVLLRLLVTEPLAEAPVLQWSSQAPSFTLQPGPAGRLEWVWVHTVGPQSPVGAHQLSGVTLEDLPGNVAQVSATPGVLPAILEIDTVPPQIQNLVVSAPNQPLPTAPPRVGPASNRRIRAQFTVLEASPAGRPRVTVGGRDVSASCSSTGAPPSVAWVCAFDGVAGDAPGSQETAVPVIVEARDAAGNAASRGATVIYDFLPPSLAAASITPSPAGLGAQAMLRLTASEPLSGPPVLTWSGPSPGFAHDPSASTAGEHVFAMTVGASLAARTYVLDRVSLTDAAGNTNPHQASPLPLSWLVDNVPPVISQLNVSVPAAPVVSSPPRARIGAEIVITFRVTEANPRGAPTVRLQGRPVSGSCTATGTLPVRNWTCRHTAAAADLPANLAPRERTDTISIDVEDVVNQRDSASAQVVLDFEPPAVEAGSVVMTLTPGTGNSLPVIEHVTHGSQVGLRFVVSEPLAANPALTAVYQPPGTPAPAPVNLALAFVSGSGGVYNFRYLHPAGSSAPNATYQVRITAQDRAGNSVAVPIAGASFVLDTTAPVAANVNTPGAIVLERRPWGDGSSDLPRYGLRFGSQAVAEGHAHLLVTNAAPPHAEIARLRAGAGGTVPNAALSMADAPTVRLVVVDRAGNASPPALVQDGLWVASMHHKVPGSSIPNPHRLTVTSHIQETLDQDPEGSREREATASETGSVASASQGHMLVQPNITWRQVHALSTEPEARRDHGLAYDSRRGRVVMFGGRDQAEQVLGDTWEFDGEQWMQMTLPPGTPSPRAQVMMTYDAARECVLLFGGANQAEQALGDTWCYDGVRWEALAPPVSPSPRRLGAMGYHGHLGVVVLFGGTTSQGLAGDTWLWDGQAWSLRPLGASDPSPRRGAAMTFLEGIGGAHLALYGGVSAAGARDDTFVWTGAWTARTPVNRPPALARPGFASDPDLTAPVNRQPRAVLFGGETASEAPSRDVWTWDGQNWAAVNLPIGLTRVSPRATPIVFDARNQRFTLFGGWGGGLVARGETWFWDGRRWAAWGGLASPPPALRGHAMGGGDRIFLFGGVAGDNTAWLLEHGRWSPFVGVFGPPPQPRSGHAVASAHPVGGEPSLLVFGGDLYSGTRSDETFSWLVHPQLGETWLRESPSVRPAARRGHAMAHFRNAQRNEVVLFGGEVGQQGVLANDTWVWNVSGRTWTQRTSSGCGAGWPAARTQASMTYDARRDRVLLFGGRNTSYLDDLWEWNGTCWSRVARSGAWPAPRARAALVFDAERQRAVLFGGDAMGAPHGDLWALVWGPSGSPWIQLAPSPQAPPARTELAAAFSEARGQVVLFGGLDGAGSPRQDTWALATGRGQRPGVRMSADWSAARVEDERIQRITVDAFGGGWGYWQSLGTGRGGAYLRLWRPVAGHWTTSSVHNGRPDTPASLTTQLAGPEAQSLVSPGSGRIDVMVTTFGLDGAHVVPELRVDHLQVSVEYSLR